MLIGMDDLGEMSSYLAIVPGMPVYSSDGKKIGEVEHLLADAPDDIFDGIVLDTSVLPGGHRFVDAPEVDRVYDRGIVLKIDAAAADALVEPSANPASLEVGADDMVPEKHAKLRRAWDLISGKG